MDDLAGLDWSAPGASAEKSAPTGSGNYYPALRPTPPISGRSTPSLPPSKGSNVPAKSSTPANDIFANLLPFNTSQSTKNLSLQERLAKQELDRRKPNEQVGASTAGAWDALGNGSSRSGRTVDRPSYATSDQYRGPNLSSTINRPFASLGGPPSLARQADLEDDNALLAAFSADAPVDSSSHFPVSADKPSRSSSAARRMINGQELGDDDDPFGLGTAPPTNKRPQVPMSANDDDDDLLGLLGRPVSEMPKKQSPSPPPVSSGPTGVSDKAVAELVDMGFSAEKSKEALAATGSGWDVQAAVGWLLNQAHERSRSTPSTRGRDPDLEHHDGTKPSAQRESSDSNAAMPAWMKQQGRPHSAPRREESKSPAGGERDAAKIAADLRSNLFKTANSLWKTGTKKLNQAVAEFNSETDAGQPKWMREAQSEGRGSGSPLPRKESRAIGDGLPAAGTGNPSPPLTSPDMTDEAMMLESRDARPRPRQRPTEPEPRPVQPESRPSFAIDPSRDWSPVVAPALRTQSPQQRFPQQPTMAQSTSKLSRHLVEEKDATAYVSPARRKKATPTPLQEDLLLGTAPPPMSSALAAAPKVGPAPQARRATSTPLVTRPRPPKRTIPHLSSIALQSSTSHRQAGTAAFKIGSYADATSSYTSSLSALPANHPLTILLLTNRALTNLKTGDPKASIADAESALAVIGPSKGEGECIDIGGAEGTKDMAQFWAKAMTRRAEALEQLERWGEAAQAWRDCVEGGVGGSLSIQGRNRCEKAAGRGNRPTTPVRRSPAVTAKKAARPSAIHASSAEAVTRLRAANKEAERVDDEKFALADGVDERLTKWRKGKEGNLRALLGSLDGVLWDGAGWKKVGMGELILPNKVKVAYMRGIAKVHPDKLPTTATTEQVMISSAVFSTLNEAWDKFRKENGL